MLFYIKQHFFFNKPQDLVTHLIFITYDDIGILYIYISYIYYNTHTSYIYLVSKNGIFSFAVIKKTRKVHLL